eukprot:1425638-Amphidinium_carterae.1
MGTVVLMRDLSDLFITLVNLEKPRLTFLCVSFIPTFRFQTLEFGPCPSNLVYLLGSFSCFPQHRQLIGLNPWIGICHADSHSPVWL